MASNKRSRAKTEHVAFRLDPATVEGKATWNETASGQSWQVAGADGSEDRGSTVLGAILDSSEGLSTISLDSTGIAVVQAWVNNPASNHGFIILDYINASDGLDFSSRENGIVSKRPKLTVAYDASPVLTIEPAELPRESPGLRGLGSC